MMLPSSLPGRFLSCESKMADDVVLCLGEGNTLSEDHVSSLDSWRQFRLALIKDRRSWRRGKGKEYIFLISRGTQ